MSFYSEHFPIARKQHQCAACQKAIEPGERYSYCAGAVDGGFWHAHYHSDCREFEITANKNGGWRDGDEWYLLHEIVANEPELLVGAPQSVRARFGLAREGYQPGPLRPAALEQAGVIRAVDNNGSVWESVNELPSTALHDAEAGDGK